MPWHQEPMKDVVNCDKPRGVENRQRSGGIRMGEPVSGNALTLLTNREQEETQRIETS